MLTRLLLPVLVLSLMAGLPATADAAPAGRTYVVAPHGAAPTRAPEPGHCPGGTADAPWGADFVRGDGKVISPIEYAMRCVTAGDTVLIEGGTYDARVNPYLQAANRGTADRPVVVRAREGARVVIRGLLRLEQPDHWEIDGIRITSDGRRYGSGEYLLKIRGGRGWEVRDGEVWGTRAGSYAAVRIERGSAAHGPNVAPDGWALRRNCIHDTADVHDGARDHNIYVHTGADAGPGAIVDNVVFGAPGGQNLKLGDGTASGVTSGAHHVRVEGNTLVDAQQNILLTGSSSDNLIRGNVLAGVLGKSWYPNVRGFDLHGAGNVVRDNLAVAGNARGEVVFVGADNGSTARIDVRGNVAPASLTLRGRDCHRLQPVGDHFRAFGAFAPSRFAGAPVERNAGRDRLATALSVSGRTFGAGSVDAVVLARADRYPDALSGAPLAAVLGAPVLLTGPDALDSRVLAEIRRLGAREVVLLGGRAALGAQVERALRSAGVAATRIGGRDRFDTAAMVAAELERRGGRSDLVYVVEGADADPGRGWPDAVAAGFLAGLRRAPVLLVTTDSAPTATQAWLERRRPRTAVVVGGTGAISDRVATNVSRHAHVVRRAAGGTRFDTSLALVNEALEHGATAGSVWLATGSDYPDALSAGAAAAAQNGVLLLVPGGDATPTSSQRTWLRTQGRELGALRLVGGAGAVSVAMEDGLRRLRTQTAD